VLEATSKVNPNNHKKDVRKKIWLAMDSSNLIKISLDVDENIVHHEEEKEITKYSIL
jgi:hypothetical protein